MKKIFISLFILTFSLLFFGAGFFLFWWWQVGEPVDAQDLEKHVFVVPKGFGVGAIAGKLKEQGLIKSQLAFKLMAAREGLGNSLQAGDFYLNKSMNLFEIIQSLTHGTVDIWLTLPEGIRREEMADIFVKTLSKHKVDFDKKGFIKETKDLEGYLFPDTYLIPKNIDASLAVKILRDNFDKKVPQELKLKASNLGLDFNQALILASLVEREAKHQNDRQLVAGILLKRFKNQWPLQVDATVQYALASQKCSLNDDDCNWWPIISDTKLESEYNTYLFPGLPPRPICNPSLESIQATLNFKDSPYWYYLSDPNGKVYFSRTLEEHQEKISQYLN